MYCNVQLKYKCRQNTDLTMKLSLLLDFLMISVNVHACVLHTPWSSPFQFIFCHLILGCWQKKQTYSELVTVFPPSMDYNVKTYFPLLLFWRLIIVIFSTCLYSQFNNIAVSTFKIQCDTWDGVTSSYW